MSAGKPVLVRGEATAFTDFATIVIARVLFGALALISVLFTTRLLAPREFGALALFFVVSLLTVTASSAWTSAAVSRLGREELELTGEMSPITAARALFVLPAFLVAVPSVLGLHAAGIFPAAFTTTLAVLSIAYAAVWIIFDHVVYLLETWGRQKLSAVAVLVQQVAYVTAIGVLYLVRARITAADIALVAMSTMGLLALTLGVLVRRVGLRRHRADRLLMRRMWAYSSPLIAFVVSQYVMRSVDLLVIGGFSTAAAVGTYALAYQGYGVIQTLATTVGPMFTPLFVSLRMAERQSSTRLFVQQLVPKLAFIGASLAAVAMAPVYALVPGLLGPGFRQVRLPLSLLFSAGAMFFAACLLGTVLAAFDRTPGIARVNLVAAAVNAVLDLVLIGGLGTGTWAAAAATIASVTIIWLGYAELAADCLGIRRRLGVLWLTPLIFATVPLLSLHGPWAVVLSAALAVAASLFVFLYGGLFRPSDVEIVELLDMPRLAKQLTTCLLRLTRG